MSLLAWRRAGRLVLLAAILAGIGLAWTYRGALSPGEIAVRLGGAPLAPLIFLLVQILASLLFVPRAVLAIAAGLMFGLWGGFLWASLGAWAGAMAGFLAARYVKGDLIDLERMPRLGPVLARAEAGGWRAVAALRLIPVLPHTLANYALGLTKVPLGSYALGSLLGQLPMTIAYIDFGAAGEKLLKGEAGGLVPTAIGVVLLGLTILLPRLLHRRSAAGAGPPVAQSSSSTVCTTGRAPD